MKKVKIETNDKLVNAHSVRLTQKDLKRIQDALLYGNDFARGQEAQRIERMFDAQLHIERTIAMYGE